MQCREWLSRLAVMTEALWKAHAGPETSIRVNCPLRILFIRVPFHTWPQFESRVMMKWFLHDTFMSPKSGKSSEDFVETLGRYLFIKLTLVSSWLRWASVSSRARKAFCQHLRLAAWRAWSCSPAFHLLANFAISKNNWCFIADSLSWYRNRLGKCFSEWEIPILLWLWLDEQKIYKSDFFTII